MNERLIPPIIKKDKYPCPRCDGVMDLKKSWVLRGRGSKTAKNILRCYLYKCESCGATLRIPRLEERGENKE